MITKTYKSGAIFGATMMVEGFGRMHVRFTEYNERGSYYTTSDANVQKALESNENFGVRFYLAETINTAEKDAIAKKVAEEVKKEIKKIEVASLQDAKEYLSMYFDIPRSSLRTKTSILSAAKEHNIEFVGI